MRLFIGYFASQKFYDKIEEIERETRPFLKGKWVEPYNLHITYEFLGEVERDKVFELIKNLSEVAKRFRPFKVVYKSLGVFPDRKNPRVLWIGVSEGSNLLKRVAREVELLNKRVGVRAKGKPFYPHLTICRIKEVRTKELSALMKKYKNYEFGEEEVNKVALIKSTLTPNGPLYSVLEEFYFYV